jgi:nucleotide-binding universal stress UspA family protein
MKTILLATDGSPSAAHALDIAVELCRDTGAHLVTLTVRTLDAHGDRDAPHGDEMDIEPVVDAVAEEAAHKARMRGIEAESRTAYGAPAVQIAEVARELRPDLVVVGSHGRGGFAGAVLGSVSRGLVAKCPVPVTVVRSEVAHTPDGAHGSQDLAPTARRG